MDKFKVGNHVSVKEDFITGTIVEINKIFNVAYVEFSTGNGGGTLPFDFDELELLPTSEQ